jgi:hypothetical protein
MVAPLKQDLEAECNAYAEHMHNLLKNDSELAKYLPVEGTELLTRVSDGVLLSKLINAIKPGLVPVAKLNRDVDLKQVGQPGSKDIFKATENQNMFLEAANKLGCKIVNVGAQDLIDSKEDLVLGVVWQIIRAHLLADVNVLSHPELIRLMRKGETIQTLLDMGSEQLLLRWFNYHLKRAGSAREVLNFSESIKDSENYLVLMGQIAPKIVDQSLVRAALETPSPEVRAVTVLDLAEKLDSRQFVTTKNIVAGHARLNLAFTATLFNNHIGIRLPTEEEIAALFDKVESLTAQVQELQSALADARKKLEDKTAEATKLLSDATRRAEEWETRFDTEAGKASALTAHVERLQGQTSAQDKLIVELKQAAQEQKEAFDRVCNDQSSINEEVMKQLKSTQEQLKTVEAKYDAEAAKALDLGQKLQELTATSEMQLKRQQSTSAKAHQAYKDKQKGQLGQIIDLAKGEMEQEALAAQLANFKAAAEPGDEVTVNLNALRWMVEQLIRQKQQLNKKVADQDGQLSRMRQMNDLMADKVKEIAEEMNNKKPSKK